MIWAELEHDPRWGDYKTFNIDWIKWEDWRHWHWEQIWRGMGFNDGATKEISITSLENERVTYVKYG